MLVSSHGLGGLLLLLLALLLALMVYPATAATAAEDPGGGHQAVRIAGGGVPEAQFRRLVTVMVEATRLTWAATQANQMQQTHRVMEVGW